MVKVICSPNAVCENIYMGSILGRRWANRFTLVVESTGGIGVNCAASNSMEAVVALATTLPSTNL